jgi:hypothetical protein
MLVYPPRLSIRLHPLIAEAKRRARRRRLAVVTVAVIAAIGVGALGRWELSGTNASAATAGSGKQCAANSSYGSACIDVRADGRRVTHIQAWMAGPSNGYLAGLRWRMDLERYVCDPIGKTKSACPATTTWHGRTRKGAARRPLTPHLVQGRTHRYWPAFGLPHTFRTNSWLCTEIAVHSSAYGWHYSGGKLPHGVRACVPVRG